MVSPPFQINDADDDPYDAENDSENTGDIMVDKPCGGVADECKDTEDKPENVNKVDMLCWCPHRTFTATMYVGG
jgi:hypothetical protein